MATSFTPRLLNDSYALKGEPREGGMAEVFPATDLIGNHGTVAIKMIGGPDHRLASKVFEVEYRSLESLEHPNVVRLLDWGRDTETNKRFLVFEWIDQDLETALGDGKTPQGWDDFVEQIGRPLFSALAAAHESSIAHRDIKPANILLTAAGVPKLADFGIAKILTDIAPGFTVADFRSKPFAAPIEEGSQRHVSGDVYSLGVTALAVLSRLDYKDLQYQDSPRRFVEDALNDIDAPAEAIAFLERCTAADSADRPPTGGVAKSELEMLTLRRDEEAKRLGFDKVPPCYLNLSRKAEQSLIDEFRLSSADEAKKLLIEDLKQKAWLLPIREGDELSDGHFFLLGGELRCHLELMSNEPRFRIHRVRPESDFYLDRDRQRAWSGILHFSLDPPANAAAAQAELSGLLDRVLDVAATQEREERGAEDSHVMGVWRRSLQALSEVERGREKPLPYSDVQTKGERVVFTVKPATVSQDLVGEMRIAELMDGSLLAGQVVRVDDGQVVLRLEQGNPEQLPRRGGLKVDLRLGKAALRRQEAALDAIQRGTASRASLRELLVAPEQSSRPEQVPEPVWIQGEFDEPKQQAVMAALGSSDFLLVEGPPGTGKTTLITELIAQELSCNPDARILLSSQTHSALDNVLERLGRLDLEQTPRLLRIGRAGDERISSEVTSLQVGAQLREWRSEMIQQSRGFLREWAEQRGISVKDVETATYLDELASVMDAETSLQESLAEANEKLEVLRDTRKAGHDTSNETVGEAQDRVARLRGELEGLAGLRAELQEHLNRLGGSGADKSEGLNSDEIRGRAESLVDRSQPDFERGSQLVRLLGEWHARFGRGPDFEAAALIRAQVVAGTCVGLASVQGWESIDFDLCIVDEASKASATEALVPMSRANRWVLVGDHRQLPPHLDEAVLDSDLLSRFELSENELRDTLFEHLRRKLPEEAKVVLSKQHRMAPGIGDLISHCFYDGELESAPRPHPDWLSISLPTPVTWLSTAGAKKRQEERTGYGRTNPFEARCIRELLGSVNLVAAAAKEKISVTVLSGYRDQTEEINRQIAEKLRTWPALEVECSTVDAFQGREADLAVYSVTRSNIEGKLGFLNERRRLNVALSRGRLGLVIVGDDDFAYAASGDNPFREVLEYIEGDPDCSIRQAMA